MPSTLWFLGQSVFKMMSILIINYKYWNMTRNPNIMYFVLGVESEPQLVGTKLKIFTKKPMLSENLKDCTKKKRVTDGPNVTSSKKWREDFILLKWTMDKIMTRSKN